MISTVLADLDAGDTITLDEVSILDDAQLNSRYWDEIPVLLINDAVHTIWRVDAARLRAALEAASSPVNAD